MRLDEYTVYNDMKRDRREMRQDELVTVAGLALSIAQMQEVLQALHESGRDNFMKSRLDGRASSTQPEMPDRWHEDYWNSHHLPRMRVRRKYMLIDVGDSGAYMIDRTDGTVYGIKGYGTVHKGHRYGNLLDLLKGAARWFWTDGEWIEVSGHAPNRRSR